MWTERKPNDVLAEPALAIVGDMKRIDGDTLVLGVGGEMGHAICVLTGKAMERASIHKKVVAVSRFHDPGVRKYLEEDYVEMIQAGLRDLKQLENLPGVPDIIYMAKREFGTDRQEWMTWGVNSVLSIFVGKKHKKPRIVAFLSGNICPMVPLASGGCMEKDRMAPVGEYTQSCLAREHTLEYYSGRCDIKVFIHRLNFAVDLRYGVLVNIADKIMNQTPISVTIPRLNCIWQGNAAEIGVRDLLHTSSPPKIMNIMGLEVISVRKVAEKVGGFLGREPVFEGEEDNDACPNSASQTMEQFGHPVAPADMLIRWQAEWVVNGGRNLGLSMYLEERGGRY